MLKRLLPSFGDALGTHSPRAGASTECIAGGGNCCPPAGLGLAQARAAREPGLTTRLALAFRGARRGLRRGECQQTLPPAALGAFSPGPAPQEAAGIPAPRADPGGEERDAVPTTTKQCFHPVQGRPCFISQSC